MDAKFLNTKSPSRWDDGEGAERRDSIGPVDENRSIDGMMLPPNVPAAI